MMASAAAGDNVHGPGGSKDDAAGGGAGELRPLEQGLKCPRCDSPNTKFCYYNNYSLAQPRYFCKTCRRYWTKGGALRNVPVGGGCRKSKKSKSSSTAVRISSDGPAQELRLYQMGFPPVVDFHLGGGTDLPFSRLHYPSPTGPGGIFNGASASADGATANYPISFGELSCTTAALPADTIGATPAPLLGFSYPIQAVASPSFTDLRVGGEATATGTNMATMDSNLTASIESLSSVNQSLHWKLQQQRLAMFFGVDNGQQQHPVSKGDSNPASFQQMFLRSNRHMPYEMPASSKDVSWKVSMAGTDTTGSTSERFLDSSTYTASNVHINLNGSSGSGSGASHDWNYVQAWGDTPHFSALQQ